MVASPLLAAAPRANMVTLEDGPALPESSEPAITFSFKEATFEQVVDFFGRAAGLPVVWEASPPPGTLRYQSDRTYGVDDGLQVLNTILQAKGVMLRRREDMLYLQPLAEMAKRDVPTFVGSLPDSVTDDEVVTLVLPLRIASASALVEQLRGLVAGYGSVSALPQQNALVVVETAAQVRRLAGMVASFDAQDTDGVVRIIKLQHVGANEIMGPLRSLLAVRVERYVVDAKGKQVKVEDEQIPGITFSPDPRTNSLIIKGGEAQIAKLEEAVRLLDVPTDRSSGRRTFSLENSTPQDLIRALGPFVNQLPRDKRPRLLPIAVTNRLFATGNDAVLEELAGLVAEYDGGGVKVPQEDGAPAIEVISLDAVRASDILPQIRGVLSIRQQQVLRMVAGPEDRTLILAGPRADVEAVKEVLPVFDKLRAGERDIVILPLRGPDAQSSVERALDLARDRLAGRAISAADQTIEAIFDSTQGAVRIEATRVGVDAFRAALDELDQIPLVAPSVRQVPVQYGEASEVASDLAALLQMLSEVHGRRPAEVSAVSAINSLLLTGSTEAVAEAESLLLKVDLPRPGEQLVRTVSVKGVADPEELLEEARGFFDILAVGAGMADAKVEASYKDEAEVIVLSGSAKAVQRMEEALQQARSAMPAEDVRRVIAVQRGDAEEVADRLRNALDEYPTAPGETINPLDISVLSVTNELVLRGPEEWVETGVALLSRVDRLNDGPLPPLRLLGVRNTDASTVADLLRRRFDARGADERRSDPVDIDVADGANVLIVTASEERQVEIKGLVDELNAFGGADREGRVIRIFPLKTAQAEELARTLDEMFPEKPVPLDRRGRPMTELREPRDVVVRANRQTNSLIVDALADRMSSFEELVRQLDREQVRTETSIRTYRLNDADPERVAASLRELSAQGVLNAAGGDRRVPVNVSVEEATKSLIVSGPEEAFARIESLIENLDVAPPRAATELRFFQLKHAQADRMAQMFRPILQARLQELMPELKDQRGALEVTAAPETNTLIVSAPVELQGVAQELVDRLDRLAHAGRRTFRTQRLDPSIADAEEIARNLRRLLEREGGPRVRVVTLEELLSEQEDSPDKKNPRSIGEGGISARSLPGMIAASALGLSSNPDDGDLAQDDVDLIVAVDAATNSLVYLGSPESIKSATELVNELAAELPPPPVEILSIDLPDSINPNALVNLLQDALLQLDVAGATSRAQRIGILSNVENNAIVVTGTESDLQLVTRLLSAIAKPESGSPREARVFRLENTDADNAVAAIYTLVGKEIRGFFRSRSRDEQPKSVTLSYAGFDPVSIRSDQVDATADWSSGTVMVTAPVKALPILSAFIADLDQQEDGTATAVKSFRLEFAQAEGIQKTILPIVSSQFASIDRYGGQRNAALEIRADARTNTLVVAGSEEQIQAVSGLVDILDVSDEAEGLRQRKIELVRVLEAEPTTVARALREQFPRGRGNELTVTVDPRTRSIAIGGTEGVLSQVRELVAMLDQPEAAEETILQTFRLDEGRAEEAVRLLTASLGLDAQGRTTGTAVLAEGSDQAVLVRARIVADRRTNAVVVNATQESMPIIERLLEDISAAPPKPMREFHVVQLEHAMADDVVYTLQRISDRGTRDEPGPSFDFERDANRVIVRATTDQWQNIQEVIGSLDRPVDNPLLTEIVSLQWSEAKQVREALGIFYGTYAYAATTPAQRSVSIVADPSTGSLVISAPEGEWDSIRSLISKLDREENDASLQLRSFTLDHADARAVARAINEAFAGELTGRNQRGGQPSRNGRDDREAPPAVLVEANEWVRASAETETNSVVVAANRNRMEKIAEIVISLDTAGEEAQGGVVEVIRIASASSAVIADELRRTFNPIAKRRNQPLSIQASVASNALIVSAPPPLMERIEQTVAALEASAPIDGESVLIIDLDHVSPQDAQRFLNSVGAGGGKDAAGRNFREPLRISPVPGRNAIVVAMNPADRERVTSLLKALDRGNPESSAEVRLVQLQRNRANDIVNIVRRVLDPGESAVGTSLAKGMAAQLQALRVHQDGGADEDLALDLTVPIKVQPDAASNTVVVTSSRPNVLAIEAFIEMLDRVPVTPAVSVNVMVLDHMAAQAFSNLLQDLSAQAGRFARTPVAGVPGLPADPAGRALLTGVAVSVDERTNAVVVAGSEEAVALAEVIRIKMDVPSSDGWLEPRLFPVQYANVEDLAARLNDLLSNAGQERDAARRFGRLRVVPPLGDSGMYDSRLSAPLDEVYVSAETRLGAILVVAEPDHLQVAAELIGMMDIPSFRKGAGFATIDLLNASAEMVADRLLRVVDAQREIGALGEDDGLLVEPDIASNAIILSGSEPALELARSVLPSLDTESSDVVVETIGLAFADPVRVADVAESLLQARSQMRQRMGAGARAVTETAVVLPDIRTNSLLVTATQTGLEIVKDLVNELDVERDLNETIFEVIPVGRAGLSRTADAVSRLLERRTLGLSADERARRQPLVIPDARTGALLVAAAPEDIDVVQTITDQLLEIPDDPALGLHVVPVPANLDVEDVARRIEQLMRERERSLGDAVGPDDRVVVEPERSANALLVAANQANLEEVEYLVELLSSTGDQLLKDREIALIAVEGDTAENMSDLLDELYVDDANRRRPNSVRVVPDSRSNGVLVNGSPGDVRAIRDLIQRLDTQDPARLVEVRTVALASANSIETVALIESVLRGGGRSRRGAATVLRYLGEDGDPVEVSLALRDVIALTPDVRTNSVIVSAPPDSLSLLVRMISDLDTSSTGAKSVRVFELVNADAAAMREILIDLFNLRQSGNLYVLKPREGGGVPDSSGPEALSDLGGGEGFLGDDLTAVPDERQQLSITVDRRTNSLLVSGTPKYLDLVKNVVEQLDSLEANERETFTVQLRNARASDVASIVSEFVEEEQRKLVGTLSDEQLGSATRLLEREITIKGDEKTNTVLVSASPRHSDRVRQLLEQLDVDPPQVLIGVMLAEVTLDNSATDGIEASVAAGGGTARGTLGFGLGTAALTGVAAPSMEVSGADFGLFLRALRAQGRLQVLSNPAVMAANNEPARLQVGDLIRVADQQSVSANGVNTTTREEQLGITLEVTPTITPDGFVRMDVKPSIRDLSARSVQISEDLISPVITTREAETTVTVKDGQTIVLGGLISDRYEKRTEKVPLLGDLPGVGYFFRGERETDARTELLIVLTPHVIESPKRSSRVSEITDREASRLTLPEEVLDMIREGRIDPTSGLFDANGARVDFSEEE